MPTEAELDALDRRIAKEWCRWKPNYITGGWYDADGNYRSHTPGNAGYTSFCRDPAVAGEARRMAEDWDVRVFASYSDVYGVQCRLWPDKHTIAIGFCGFDEVNNDKAAAEALATARAIEAALNARGGSE